MAKQTKRLAKASRKACGRRKARKMRLFRNHRKNPPVGIAAMFATMSARTHYLCVCRSQAAASGRAKRRRTTRNAAETQPITMHLGSLSTIHHVKQLLMCELGAPHVVLSYGGAFGFVACTRFTALLSVLTCCVRYNDNRPSPEGQYSHTWPRGRSVSQFVNAFNCSTMFTLTHL